jgi:hypothetical protein
MHQHFAYESAMAKTAELQREAEHARRARAVLTAGPGRRRTKRPWWAGDGWRGGGESRSELLTECGERAVTRSPSRIAGATAGTRPLAWQYETADRPPRGNHK